MKHYLVTASTGEYEFTAYDGNDFTEAHEAKKDLMNRGAVQEIRIDTSEHISTEIWTMKDGAYSKTT